MALILDKHVKMDVKSVVKSVPGGRDGSSQ